MKMNQFIKLSIILLFFLSIFTRGNASYVTVHNPKCAYTFLSDNQKSADSECIQALNDFSTFIDNEENKSKKLTLALSYVQTENSSSEYQTSVVKSSEFHISDFILFESDTSPPAKGQDL